LLMGCNSKSLDSIASSSEEQQRRPTLTQKSKITLATSSSSPTTTTATSSSSLPAKKLPNNEKGGGEGGDIINTTITEEEESTSNNNQPSSAATAANNTTSSSTVMVAQQLLLITIISISTVYHTWLYRVDILANQIPFAVAVHWILTAYFIGSSSSSSSTDGEKKVLYVSIRDDDKAGHEEVDAPTLTSEASNRHVTFTQEEEQQQQQRDDDDEAEENEAEAKAKQLLRRIPMGRRHYAKMKAAYYNNKSKESTPVEEFFTNLKPHPIIGFGATTTTTTTTTTTKRSSISDAMMNRLLKYPDFGRRKSLEGEIDRTQLDEGLEEEDIVYEEEGEEEQEERNKNYEIGTAPLINLRASKLERDFDCVVEPLCKFRGMDFFVGDYPEKEIWKQPLLLK